MERKEKPIGTPTRVDTHKEIKMAAVSQGKSMVDFVDEVWSFYKKHNKKLAK